MKALVTGATGFVGSHLVEALQRHGTEVTALARSRAKAAELSAAGVKVVYGDLDDRPALEQAAQGQDQVYHVAGVVAARNEEDFLRFNRDGTGNMLRAAERSGVARFVLVSSLAAAGPAAPGVPLSGTEEPRPVTAYGRSKLAAEQVVRSAQCPWTVIRPPMVYGPRDREVLKIFRIARLGFAPVFGDGRQELSAVHAADLATALMQAAVAPAATGRIYHASHPEIFSSAHLGRAIGTVMGRSVSTLTIPRRIGLAALATTETFARLTGGATILTTDKANEFFQAAWTGDPSRLMQDTGWQPTYDLQGGLAQTYRWYREAGWL
jgi:nucleoside-diphosphate-sugar epimerase